jgi:hypothetical protein
MTIPLRRAGVLVAAALLFALTAVAGAPAASANGGWQIWNKQQSWFQNLCLEVDNASTAANSNVTVDWCTHGGLHQEWYVEGVGSGFFRIRSGQTGMCLDIRGATAADGAQVVVNPCRATYTPSQHWRIVDKSPGFELYINRLSGKCLDKSGSNVVQWGCHGWDWQQWTFHSAPYV